ncbi:MAG: GNAT family N-acetyltransferase [Nocardioidaceae bacterium]
MSTLHVRSFAEDDIPAAGALLAARHRRHRTAQPLLSPAYDAPTAAAEAVRDAWSAERASGTVAERDGRVVGYLVGSPKADDVWGPNIWIEAAGVAADNAEDARDLYAHAAASWVAEGRIAHYVVLPARDPLVSAFFRLAFGHQHTHAIRPLPDGPISDPRVRGARRDDIPVLARLEVELPLHQGRSPVFSSGTVPIESEAAAEWDEDFDDPDYATFVVEVDGAVVGSAVGCALEKSSLHRGVSRPDHAGFLGFAAVLPEARGRGLGRALGEAVLDWCRTEGFDSVVTDWRETNLRSSRAWPALGFEPSFLRLHRVVGH